MVDDIEDERRVEPDFGLGERDMLEGWLEFHRMTLLFKCEGLSDAARKQRPVPTSTLSLHGLVRHMAEVERGWFTSVLLKQPDAPNIYAGPPGSPDEDAEIFPLDEADWETDLATWHVECQTSRSNARDLPLDHVGDKYGQPVTLRWIYNHMIEEYARHNGHADLLRELVDGAVGW